jgi:hypothetical protein
VERQVVKIQVRRFQLSGFVNPQAGVQDQAGESVTSALISACWLERNQPLNLVRLEGG